MYPPSFSGSLHIHTLTFVIILSTNPPKQNKKIINNFHKKISISSFSSFSP